MTRAELKKLVDNAIGKTSTFIEPTGCRGEYYLHLNVWFLTAHQLDSIRSKVRITSLSVEGGRLLLTVKI